MRHDIGLDRLLFGVDYPHPEGTWPNTVQWIQHTFQGVPEDEARQILGENAVRCYGFDAALLGRVADRIGRAPAELLGNFEIDPRRIEIFHERSGLSRGPEDVDTAVLEQFFDEDLAVLAKLA
jgi:hypothetical protein